MGGLLHGRIKENLNCFNRGCSNYPPFLFPIKSVAAEKVSALLVFLADAFNGRVRRRTTTLYRWIDGGQRGWNIWSNYGRTPEWDVMLVLNIPEESNDKLEDRGT